MEVAVCNFNNPMLLKEGKSERIIFLDEEGTLDNKNTVAFINTLMKLVRNIDCVFASSNRSSITPEEALKKFKKYGLNAITEENLKGGTPTFFDYGEDGTFAGFGAGISAYHIDDMEGDIDLKDAARGFETMAAAKSRGCSNYICFDDRPELYADVKNLITPNDIEGNTLEAVYKVFTNLCGDKDKEYNIEDEEVKAFIDAFIEEFQIEYYELLNAENEL